MVSFCINIALMRSKNLPINKEKEAFYQNLFANSKVSPEEMGNTIQTRLRSVDSAITTQKYCFIAEPNSFHSGLPMQGDKEFKSWPRFSPKVMALIIYNKEEVHNS